MKLYQGRLNVNGGRCSEDGGRGQRRGLIMPGRPESATGAALDVRVNAPEVMIMPVSTAC